MQLLVIHGSSRKEGNTKDLTKVVLNSLEQDQYQELDLLDYNIQPIIDERHTEFGFTPVADDYETVIKELLQAQTILFVTPLYWFAMSGRLKNFIDRFSQSLRNADYDFKEQIKGKKAYVLVVGGEKAPLTALPLIQQFQLIFQFLGIEFAGYCIGKGVKPQEVLQSAESITAAKFLGDKIKADL